MIFGFVIFALVVVIFIQIYERQQFTKTMLKQLDDAIKASMSRNVNEYMSAKEHDPTKEATFEEPDEIPLDQADDKLFDRSIGIKDETT